MSICLSLVIAGSWPGIGSSIAYASDSRTSSANPVIVWDRNAETAIWDVARQQPQVQARSFAMVHGAVYDAVNAIAGAPTSRTSSHRPPTGASRRTRPSPPPPTAC
ncbi:hypothetical protein ACFQYP_50305 [Nonomuraea antimicrobica]